MASATFCELRGAGLIAARGIDAVAFLQTQLTSDLAGTEPLQTQYSGYCTPQGRLLATFLLWRTGEDVVLQLPYALREALQTRLSKYVMRSRVKLADATPDYRLFGVSGQAAGAALSFFGAPLPEAEHAVVSQPGVSATKLALERYLLLADAQHAERIRKALAESAEEHAESDWASRDIEAGVAVLTPATQEKFVPQMVNLDLLGGMSYGKGCYPGQEIVARMHYLGRLKQRMYRAHIPGTNAPVAADSLYSREFGPDQACGTIVSAAPDPGGGFIVLVVVQKSSAAQGDVRWKSADGPALAFLSLPYAVPE